eukprot:m51a1_g13096 hypothetical protein (209) ;mRNA; f:1348-2778
MDSQRCCASIVEAAELVLSTCKTVNDLTQTQDVDALYDAACVAEQQAAAFTHLINSDPIKDSLKSHYGMLSTAAEPIGTAVSELVSYAKMAVSNPLDFLSSQGLRNGMSTVTEAGAEIGELTKTLASATSGVEADFVQAAREYSTTVTEVSNFSRTMRLRNVADSFKDQGVDLLMKAKTLYMATLQRSGTAEPTPPSCPRPPRPRRAP